MKPIAQILREKAMAQLKAKKEAGANKKVEVPKSLSKLEEKIAQLEEAVDSDESISDDGSDESDINKSDSESPGIIEEEDPNEGLVFEKDKKGNVIRIVSKLEKEARIAPLPKEFLPQSQCHFANKANSSSGAADSRKRRISFADDQPNKKYTGPNHVAMKTIQQLLENYEAPKEKIPFYCKICKFQGKDLESFNNHRDSEFHRLATMMGQRVSYCKICRKQFTSPDQLNEHNKGKAHLERLEMIREAHSELGTPSNDDSGYDRNRYRQFSRD